MATTQVVMDSKVEAQAIKNMKAFASAEGDVNGHIVRLGSDAMKYWAVYGRKTGAEKFKVLCQVNGIRRIIDTTVQRRFAGFGFLSAKNSRLAGVGERVWQTVVDRAVKVSANGAIEWAFLRDSNGNETDVTAEKTFSEIADFSAIDGDVMNVTFPPKKTDKQRENEKAEAAGQLILPENWKNALKDKTIPVVKAAFSKYFAGIPNKVIRALMDELRKIDKKQTTPSRKRDKVTGETIPEPEVKEETVTV